MGNKCCKNDSNLEGYPKNDEEKKAMKRPFVAATTPKWYLIYYTALTLNLENSIIGAHVDCPRTSLSAMVHTKVPHINLLLLWPQRSKTIFVCANRPKTNLTATELTANWISDFDPIIHQSS